MLLPYLAIQTALAGYGDAVDGVPSPEERELHLWTNAVRVEPEAFSEFYDCGFESFTAHEQTPQRPLLWQDGLGEAARFHTDDMVEADHFSHTSSDGTSFDARVARYYEGMFIGENIAMGYADPWQAVVVGWMCSSGHRANIMSDFEELGTGVRGTWYTQDFGSRGVDLAEHALRLGAHSPVAPEETATLLTAFYDDAGAPPATLSAVVNGQPHAMEIAFGTPDSGVFSIDIEVSEACTTYFFEAERDNGTTVTFPEAGVYGFGDCAWVDPEAQWMYRDDDGFGYGDGGQSDAVNDDAPHREWRKWPFGGCSTTPQGPNTPLLFLLLFPLLARRRS